MKQGTLFVAIFAPEEATFCTKLHPWEERCAPASVIRSLGMDRMSSLGARRISSIELLPEHSIELRLVNNRVGAHADPVYYVRFLL